MIKINIGQKIKKIFSTEGVDPLKVEATPYRDWRIIVLSFIGVLTLSLAFHIYMSVQINNDSFFATTPKKYEGQVFNRDGLHAALDKLNKKDQILSGVATTTTPVVVDPSL